MPNKFLLKIVDSVLDPGLLSIRTINGGHARSFKRTLKNSGYKPGDVLICRKATQKEISDLLPQSVEASRE